MPELFDYVIDEMENTFGIMPAHEAKLQYFIEPSSLL